MDYSAPATRNAFIFRNCAVKALVVDRALVEPLVAEFGLDAPLAEELTDLRAFGVDLVLLRGPNWTAAAEPPAEADLPEDLAYILYTSGSTGVPKGVMHTHNSALAFVDWCSEVFEPAESDRFSSHAPFHFDLSILDLYVPLKHGATLVLVGEDVGKQPLPLASLIADEKITAWYSTPSILALLVQYGKVSQSDFPDLRWALFAGEVFPVKHLRALKSVWKKPRYLNLYGPTETNVCTYYEIPEEIPEERTDPYPIGRACSHVRTKVMDSAGVSVDPGCEGELCVSGPAVMSGYWNMPEQTAEAFFEGDSGEQWYRTGDLVIEDKDGDYIFLGRRDRMVKRMGFRVELGEIEAGLYRHPAIEEAGVIAVEDDERGVRIIAFVCCPRGERPSIIEMKAFCAEVLPRYMIPDRFLFRDSLPRTSTDKIDYQELKGIEI